MRKIIRMPEDIRVVPGILLALIIWVSVQAATLQNLRFGITEKRSRLVYQLDNLSPYEIDFDKSTVRITFESLTINYDQLDAAKRNRGGMFADFSYSEQNGKVLFEITASEAFHIRYFELTDPDRLVVDLYPRKPAPVTTTPKIKDKPNYESKQETLAAKPTTSEEVVLDQPADTLQAEEETAMHATESSVPDQEQETPQTPPPDVQSQKGQGAPGWLYIGLPIVIVILLIIGFTALRRAKRDEPKEEAELETEEEWSYSGDRFRKLLQIDRSLEPAEPDVIDEGHEGDGEVVGNPEAEPRSPEEDIERDDKDDKLKEKDDQEEHTESEETVKESTPAEEDISEPAKLEETDEKISEDVEAGDQSREKDIPEQRKPVDSSVEEPETETEEKSAEETSEAAKKPTKDDTTAEPKDTEKTDGDEAPVRIQFFDGEDKPEESVSVKNTADKPPSGRRVVDAGEAILDIDKGAVQWPIHILDGERTGRIMVIDDEVEIVSFLQEYLESENYDVLGLTDGREAIGIFSKWHPDLVITDVVMPGLSGINLVEKIRENHYLDKVIFLSGRTEKDNVAKSFPDELENGQFEFFRKPLSLVQIGGRIRDYFSTAQEILYLNIENPDNFEEILEPLNPHQLVPLQQFLWDKIFEISANILGRRIEPYFITDRMEPPANYMHRMGCQEREDYCIANICFGSNPVCAAGKLRGEIEVMRQILTEFRKEYLESVKDQSENEGDSGNPSSGNDATEPTSPATTPEKETDSPPPRQSLDRPEVIRKR
ncbi:hypothetical protein CEE37_09190 [candidate division LCP-89 bacterium B3_LCP]|uniref:Response regulatory domain-containing protein n=1 Tax=candidate division LCP-89 bacterium B3_LCP TaxID=2012998 RepID=A0A532V0I5_UNCL8|nr:MAG: hypothetical protein CEE37_09190 [candidate division LCP-89 bacterium B3_LCP]